MQQLKLITPPTEWPVTLDEAKLHCKVDAVDEDLLLQAFIRSATGMAEHQTGRRLMPQTWQLTLDAVPSHGVQLSHVPVKSISSINYIDTNGVSQLWAPTNYTLNNSNDYGVAFICPSYGMTWPSMRAQMDALRITFVCGYDSAALVPEEFKHWIKLMVGAMFTNREAYDEDQVYSLGFADRLLDRYKVWTHP